MCAHACGTRAQCLGLIHRRQQIRGVLRTEVSLLNQLQDFGS